MEWSASLFRVAKVCIGLALKQKVDELGVTIHGGKVKRALSIVVLDVCELLLLHGR